MKVDHLFPPKPDLIATPVLVDHPEVGGVVLRGVGRPWGDGPPEEKADWDGMELISTSKAYLDRLVAALEARRVSDAIESARKNKETRSRIVRNVP